MRRLVQPGPVSAERIESFACGGREVSFRLEPGMSLNQALTAPLVAAGIQSAALTFSGGVLSPFVYVVPALPNDALHVAYFSTPRVPGRGEVVLANATFGWRDGEPFVHCHGTWMEPDGRLHGGHMMPHETFIDAGTEVRAWATPDVRIAVEPDPETNFPLFRPLPTAGDGGRFVVARVRPNEDICTALEAICRRHGIREAVVRASLGSLVGARFTGGAEVTDHCHRGAGALRACPHDGEWCAARRAGHDRGGHAGRGARGAAGAGREPCLHHVRGDAGGDGLT